jgi:hypothetical protein
MAQITQIKPLSISDICVICVKIIFYNGNYSEGMLLVAKKKKNL